MIGYFFVNIVNCCRLILEINFFLFFRFFFDYLIYIYYLKGVEIVFKKYVEKVDSKGVKVYFRMDEDGILYLDRVR